jgi:hypothetical protein
MKCSTLLALLLVLILSLLRVYGQAGGAPVHVSGPTSTTADPPLRKFLPSTNPYAQQLLTDQFAIIDDIQNVNPEVLALFHAKVPARDIANRGERFNPTDVEIGTHLPSRRFVLAGSSPRMWFILYEVGGIGYHHNLVIFSKDKKWSLVVSVTGFLEKNTFDSLKQAISAGKFFDQPGYPQY